MVVEPVIGLVKLLEDFHMVVDAAGADQVAMCGVDLCFLALGEAGTEGGAEIEAAVALVADGDLRLDLEADIVAARG